MYHHCPCAQEVTCLNNCRPVALTPVSMKSFERIILAHIKDNIPTDLDSHHLAYQVNRSAEDACYSWALALASNSINWFLNSLNVRMGSLTSATIILNTQGCVLGLALFTQDCAPIQPRNTRVKFADDTTVVGLIGHNNQTYYRQEVQHLAEWGLENNVVLNTTKTSGRRLQEYNTAPFSSIEQRWREGFPSNSWEPTLQRTWHGHWAPPVCWRGPSRGSIFLPPQLLTNVYRSTTESIPCHSCVVWDGSYLWKAGW